MRILKRWVDGHWSPLLLKLVLAGGAFDQSWPTRGGSVVQDRFLDGIQAATQGPATAAPVHGSNAWDHQAFPGNDKEPTALTPALMHEAETEGCFAQLVAAKDSMVLCAGKLSGPGE
jgi:hypothetical protein